MSDKSLAFTSKPDLPWASPRGLESVLTKWDKGRVRKSVVFDHVEPAVPAEYAPIPSDLAPQVKDALVKRGISELYSHQARAFELGRDKKSFVVATPTASGKSLCYHLPVLDAFAKEHDARALYLFPTKALSRDQEESLRGFLQDADLAHGAITYDGDTPGDARRVARQRSGVLITNPDMLHAGILPHHASWARLFANLRYIVVDELHTYRGVFGSHLANVMRRLIRVARFHGSDPVFIGASATIGNPREHGARVMGREVEVVDQNGAPRGARRVLVYNPPVVNRELGIRASYLKSTVRLATDLVKAEVPTLVFGQSRNGVEVMLKYLRDRFTQDGLDASMIHAYRGGYLPKARRAIERSLRAGDIRCVVATNALELGIDVGSLDAVICAGYPGTLAGTWQRFGRAGRREGKSLGVLVTSSNPLDQFIARDPKQLTNASIEHARIDPDNVEILIQHLKCAAFELPFEDGDRFGDLPIDSLKDALGFLAHHEIVHEAPNASGGSTYHWATDAYPANHVSLRNVGWDNFVVIDLDTDKTIAEMDWRSTHTMLHEQAIYQHAGAQFQVERLDFDNHKAYVRRVKPDYYTTAMTHTDVRIMEQDQGAGLNLKVALPAAMGEVSVVEKVVGYKKIKYHTHENVGYGDVHLPEMQMHTTSFWLTFPEDFIATMLERAAVRRPAVIDALRGILNAMHTVATVGLMVDPRDLGRTLQDGEAGEPSARGFDPTLFLFDRVAGGIGLASRLFQERDALLRRTRVVIERCDCGVGCPACIGPDAGVEPEGGPTRERLDLTLAILDAVGVPAVH